MRAKLLGFKLPCTEKEAIGYNFFYMDPPSAVCKDRKRLEAVCLTKRFLCARYPNTMHLKEDLLYSTARSYEAKTKVAFFWYGFFKLISDSSETVVRLCVWYLFTTCERALYQLPRSIGQSRCLKMYTVCHFQTILLKRRTYFICIKIFDSNYFRVKSSFRISPYNGQLTLKAFTRSKRDQMYSLLSVDFDLFIFLAQVITVS